MSATVAPEEDEALSSAAVDPPTAEELDQYRTLFLQLADKRGAISVEELDSVFSNLGLFSTREELEAIAAEMELDSSMPIDFDQFSTILHRLNGEEHRIKMTPSFFGGIPGKAPPTFRMVVWQTMEDPSFSPLARIISISIMLLIFVSIVTYIVETMPEVRSVSSELATVESFCIIVFTVEYVVRLVVSPDKLEFFKGALNAVDLVSIVPWYVDALVDDAEDSGTTAVLRIFRLVRVTRIFKISRYISWIKLITFAVVNSIAPLGMAIFITLIATVILGSAMYYIERGTWDPHQRVYLTHLGTPTAFVSIPEACWWCIITMTTVGYGDVAPVSSIGKALACATSLSGIVLLAIPISVFSANFAKQYSLLLKKRALQQEQGKDLKRQISMAMPRHLKTVRSLGSAGHMLSFRGGSDMPPLVRAQSMMNAPLEKNSELHHAMQVMILSARKRLWHRVHNLEKKYRERICYTLAGRWAKWFDSDASKLEENMRGYLMARDMNASMRGGAMPPVHESGDERKLHSQFGSTYSVAERIAGPDGKVDERDLAPGLSSEAASKGVPATAPRHAVPHTDGPGTPPSRRDFGQASASNMSVRLPALDRGGLERAGTLPPINSPGTASLQRPALGSPDSVVQDVPSATSEQHPGATHTFRDPRREVGQPKL